MKLRHLLAALLIVGIASALRAGLFADLGRATPYLTYYPAVVLAAFYGGLRAGMVAAAASACICFYWIQRGQMSHVESLAMGAFVVSCAMISWVAEAMRRAQALAREARDRAESANRAKSAFLANMSHELRTPLNAILGFTEVLRRGGQVTQEQRNILDIVGRSGEHLLTLINDVLDMAKIDAGRIALDSADFELTDMLRECIDLVGGRAAEKGLQLRLEQAPDLPRCIRSDRAKLRQVLINLLGNAIKFTEHGGVILRLAAACADRPGATQLIIEVEDSGIGVAEPDRQRIFEPFVQAAGDAGQMGTGLGLSIARQFVSLMGGQIAVHSTAGKGATFRVELPVELAESAGAAAAGSPLGVVVGLAAGQGDYRILIVEDRMENWLLLRQLLEPVGFQVRVAENGAAGVALCQEWRPHFVWMDIRMPVMDGLEATQRIRELPGGRQIRIAAITASVFKEERDEIMAAGMDDFIRKPFRADEIYACLARQLGVRFNREAEAALPPAPEETARLSAPALATLPAELRDELAAALVTLSAERINAVISRIAERDRALGELLARDAARLHYSSIRNALAASPGGAA